MIKIISKQKKLPKFPRNLKNYQNPLETYKMIKIPLEPLGYVWYICLKTENCYLKIFMEIHVDEKICENVRNVV